MLKINQYIFYMDKNKQRQQKNDKRQQYLQPNMSQDSSINQPQIFQYHQNQKGLNKIKQLLELDRLLKKYSEQLAENQTPLVESIVRKFKRIHKNKILTKKFKKSNQQVQKVQKVNIKNLCYICGIQITKPHIHYSSMCQTCGDFNFKKREAKANLQGKIALVTGARIKIGYFCCLSLLRNGAYVIATTRFANDAIQRYMKENDYSQWKDRIEIVQTSMNSLKSITQLSNYVKQKFKTLDILIINAAQTIRRPKAFYSSLEKPKYDPDNLVKLIIDDYFEFNNDKIDMAIEYQDIKKFVELNPSEKGEKELLLIREQQNQGSQQIEVQCDLMKKVSNTKLQTFDKETVKHYYDKFFPKDIVDQHSQQIDLRPINSWVRSIEDINVLELGQVLMINCVAPFTLIQQLCPLMKRQSRDQSTYIVNVSSMEGCFSRRFKTQFHPHTNLSKSALNMITRTCGEEFSKNNIMMVSVDTGWNTIQQPNSYEQKSPLDCIDGAARILDPIYRKLTKPGVFYKNYSLFDW